jgi:hypothetical protein
VHLRGCIGGVGHSFETRQQAVAKAFHQHAAMARQYLGNGDADEICPSTDCGGFVLLHEPDRFHEVDQQDDGLLPHQPNVSATDIRQAGRHGAISSLVCTIGHVDPARDPARPT